MALFKEALCSIIGACPRYLFLDHKYKRIINKSDANAHIADFTKIAKNKTSKDVYIFKCLCGKHCIAMPIKQGGNLFGYILALHLRKPPDKKSFSLAKLFMDIALRESQKEQELIKLYDTIRPRAIALSTIHTVHRLLSSTLDLNELIERIARLASQVMRAKYCAILLMDDSGKYLITKAINDIKNHPCDKRPKYRKIKIGSSVIGRVAKTGKVAMSRSSISVPLIEEDVIGVICAKYKTNNLPFNKFDMEILLTLAEQAVIAIKNAQLYEEQEKMAYGSIKSLTALLDTKSPSIYTHTEKFSKIILAIAEEIRLPREEIRNLRYAALIPDTGRFSIPDEILKKPGGLSIKEYEIIKKQHLESLKILEPLEFLKPAMPIIIYHHEKYDGTGYPLGLKGDSIPIGARIMAVADAFEAMISARPYKNTKISISEVTAEIERNKGTQFDPKVVEAFTAVLKKPEFKTLF